MTTKTMDSRDWTTEPLCRLVDYILETYHAAVRDELPRLQALATIVTREHGAKLPELAALERTLRELAFDVSTHVRKEEIVLFPAIRALEDGDAEWVGRLGTPVTLLEHDHDSAARMLAELRSMTNDYVAPEWGCETFRALYRGLSDLEASLARHLHLEASVLFPRALRLADALPA